MLVAADYVLSWRNNQECFKASGVNGAVDKILKNPSIATVRSTYRLSPRHKKWPLRISTHQVGRVMQTREASHVNHPADFTADGNIRSSRSNKGHSSKQKINGEWHYTTVDDYVLCGDEGARKGIQSWETGKSKIGKESASDARHRSVKIEYIIWKEKISDSVTNIALFVRLWLTEIFLKWSLRRRQKTVSSGSQL